MCLCPSMRSLSSSIGLNANLSMEIKNYSDQVGWIEKCSKFGSFFPEEGAISSLLTEHPMVLVLGQYSTGKTTLISHILGRNYPGQVVSPEPTTDGFVVLTRAVGNNTSDSAAHASCGFQIPGEVLISAKGKPFEDLKKFGQGFWNRFSGVAIPRLREDEQDILDSITLVDTPGILSGGDKGKNWGREYDFHQVLKWFIQRAHRVLVIFDAYKLDVSIEMAEVLLELKNHQNKTRLVLNKSDAVSPNELLRVYGALLWRLGKIWSSPEVVRAYVVSMWDQPIHPRSASLAKWLLSEEEALIDDLVQLRHSAPAEITRRKLARLRKLRAHLLILQRIRKSLPSFLSTYVFGSQVDENYIHSKVLKHIDREFRVLLSENQVMESDLPDLSTLKKALLEHRHKILELFPGTKALKAVDRLLQQETQSFPKPLGSQSIKPPRILVRNRDRLAAISPDSKSGISKL